MHGNEHAAGRCPREGVDDEQRRGRAAISQDSNPAAAGARTLQEMDEHRRFAQQAAPGELQHGRH
eukprot:5868031-Pleurochrysis_carterae.AAC.1